MSSTLSYSLEDFFFVTKPDEESLLDKKLQAIWENKVKEGCFKYELCDLKTKYLPGKYMFILQLNINRAVSRRQPQLISDVEMRFDPEQFHFGKVHDKEVIFAIEPQHWIDRNCHKHVLLINVSPLEYCHSLLVPCIENCLPQVLNIDGFQLAVELMLKSKSNFFRIGFNSLGGFASVNHLHFHAYYLKYKLFLEEAPVNHLKGPCYELLDFPSKGFVFEILNYFDIEKITRAVTTLTNDLCSSKISHNVFLTRGTSLSKPNAGINEYSAIRIYVWARETCYGVKNEMAFNVAVCELAGHISMKNKESFECITEEDIVSQLNKACHDTFYFVKPMAVKLYE